MTELELLKQAEILIAMSYWENFKFEKELALPLGGQHPKIKQLNNHLNDIREEWHDIKHKLKEFEGTE